MIIKMPSIGGTVVWIAGEIRLGWGEHVSITVHFSVTASIKVRSLFCGVISVQSQLEKCSGLVGRS